MGDGTSKKELKKGVYPFTFDWRLEVTEERGGTS